MGKDSLRVLYHEAFHQYIHYAVGDVAPHSWFNEGHGDYFAGHNYRGRKFKSDVFRWRTGIIANALPVVNISPFWQMAISGGAIIIAVVLNAQANRSPGRIILKRAEHVT